MHANRAPAFWSGKCKSQSCTFTSGLMWTEMMNAWYYNPKDHNMNQQQPPVLKTYLSNIQNVSPCCDPIKITESLKTLQNSNWNHIMGAFPWTVLNCSEEIKNLWKGQWVSTNSVVGGGEPNLILQYTFTTNIGIPKRSISMGLNRPLKLLPTSNGAKQWWARVSHITYRDM